uniref:Uncharacterized protein n=1 Tax=Octopus bimaculoides TaxID=37653 RepID=A0A0L8GT26_OCTBM
MKQRQDAEYGNTPLKCHIPYIHSESTPVSVTNLIKVLLSVIHGYVTENRIYSR